MKIERLRSGVRRRFIAVGLTAVLAVAGSVAIAGPALAFNPCNGPNPSAYPQCGPHRTPPPPPAPTPPPAYTEVCNPFCNLYWTRSATKVIDDSIEAHASLVQATDGAIGGVVCAAVSTAGLLPGVLCAVIFGLQMIDLGYSIDEWKDAATADDCVRIPEYVPWDDPIPYNGTYCRN